MKNPAAKPPPAVVPKAESIEEPIPVTAIDKEVIKPQKVQPSQERAKSNEGDLQAEANDAEQKIKEIEEQKVKLNVSSTPVQGPVEPEA